MLLHSTSRCIWRVVWCLLASMLCAAMVSGCVDIRDPDVSATSAKNTTTQVPAPDAGDPAPERGGTIPSNEVNGQLSPAAAQPTPDAALARYAVLYANWSASNVLARQRQLASISLGQARAQALQAAASVVRDTELARSHVSNHGQLVAIARGQGPANGNWLVVVREQTTGRGTYAALPPTLHVTYAQVVQTARGWVVTRWSPQN